MRRLITILGFILVAVGVLDLIAPDVLVTIGRQVLTPTGIYVIAGLRICVGLLLFAVAPTSRMPRAVRILGIVAVIAGIATPLFGVDRSLAVLDWWAGHGPIALRFPALILASLGSFVIYAMGSVRRPAV